MGIAFVALPSKKPEIRGFEWGLNNSPEGLNKGLTHFIAKKTELFIYLTRIIGILVAYYSGILDDVVVVDFWTN